MVLTFVFLYSLSAPHSESQHKHCLQLVIPTSMAYSVNRSSSGFSFSEHWLIVVASAVICGFLGYIVYDAVMATASELLQRLLVISPLLLIIVVHWLSTGSQLSFPMPGSEPGAIHRAGGSPWGVAFVLLLLFFLISYQPSLHGFIA
ncbi:uncharacterized protein LOC130967837 isoform X2 [Arachis stenosperma]|uniref:uncharacterized protein LOC130967837 isoform X2 n=1 Tax=Arachis stenosperma TaxID=217475 RepID=UPI0025ABE6BF|nr:uncharacterized protein LOC130967837 isoform X2 [Arachis stenosperma]